LSAAGPLAHAEISSTLTVASDYDFRGVSQSALDPALQISLDWSGESGLYAGLWASNVDFGPGSASDAELDYILGFTGGINDDLSYDLGVNYFTYLDGGDNIDYAEFYAGLQYKNFGVKYWFANDFVNSGDSASYIEANLDVALPKDFTLTLHAGYSDGDYWGSDAYFDYAIGVARDFGKFTVDLKWIDGSDLRAFNGTPGNVGTSESKVFLSVSTTLPW
jgi:uncharacterized protein (TIGR02001 family)